jgi:hypothetical protein
MPNSQLAILDAGHLVWEEAPGDHASIVPKPASSRHPSFE